MYSGKPAINVLKRVFGGGEAGRSGSPAHAGGKWYGHLENNLAVSYKVKCTEIHMKTSKQRFTAAVLITAETSEQPKCLDEET